MFSIDDEPISPRRKWTAIGAATFVMLLSYWSLVFAFVAGAAEDESVEVGFGNFAFGVGIVPFAFMVLAFGSKHRKAATGVLKAMGLFLVVGVSLVLFANLLVGLVAGFGAGGIVTLRDEEEYRVKHRVLAVLAATVWVLVLSFVAPGVGVITGGIVPFLALGLADYYSENKAADAAS